VKGASPTGKQPPSYAEMRGLPSISSGKPELSRFLPWVYPRIIPRRASFVGAYGCQTWCAKANICKGRPQSSYLRKP